MSDQHPFAGLPQGPTPIVKKSPADLSNLPGMARVLAERDALDVCLKTAAHDATCGCDHCSRGIRCTHCRRAGCQNPEHVETVRGFGALKSISR